MINISEINVVIDCDPIEYYINPSFRYNIENTIFNMFKGLIEEWGNEIDVKEINVNFIDKEKLDVY